MRTSVVGNVRAPRRTSRTARSRPLDDVFDFYLHVDRDADPDLADRSPMPIDPGARSDLEAFFGAISDAPYDRTVPDHVPSGLHPGGAIP
jgi:hypothetical protein